VLQALPTALQSAPARSAPEQIVQHPARRDIDHLNGTTMTSMSSKATPSVDRDAIRSTLVEIISRQLKIAPAYLRANVGLHEYGADSHTFTAVQQGIENHFGLRLSSRSVLEHRSLDALVGLVEQQVQHAVPVQVPATPAAHAAARAEPNGLLLGTANGLANGASHTVAASATNGSSNGNGHAAPASAADPAVVKALELLEAGQLQAADVRRIIDLLAAR
jgi:acyl carrier protein